MVLFDPENPRPIHFMGIAGAGMGALALVAHRRGIFVTGSDLDLANAADLISAGVEVSPGHDPAYLENVRAVIHTSAVEARHPMLVAAAEAGIPIIRRAEALAQLIEGGEVVGVSGTHGKTTTSAMTTEVLAATGNNPTGIVGGRVEGWSGNARLGGDHLFVVEADEYDRSFLALNPDIAVINNIEAEHIECYGSLQSLEDAFTEFAGRAKHVMVSSDDPGARRVAQRLSTEVWGVGMNDDAYVRIGEIREESDKTMARVSFPREGGTEEIDLSLRLPGEHNIRNAAMALAVAAARDEDLEVASRALASFRGVGRRFQTIGTTQGVTIVDDYAHHATELFATLSAARRRYPHGRMIAVFQPHLFSRTQRQSEAMGAALSLADVTVVTDVYPARERPIEGVSGRMVVDVVSKAGGIVHWVERRDDLVEFLSGIVRPGDIVLTLGAGDITLVAGELFQRLAGAAA